MECSKVRELIPLAAGSDLESADQASIEAHAASCGPCESKLAEYTALKKLLAEESARSPQADLWDRVRPGLPRRRGRLRPFGWAAAAAAVLAAGFALGVLVTSERSVPDSARPAGAASGLASRSISPLPEPPIEDVNAVRSPLPSGNPPPPAERVAHIPDRSPIWTPGEILQEPPRNAVDLQAAFAHAAAVSTASVVHITTRGPFIVPDAIGSGVIVSDQGHIVTNDHVVRFVKEGSVRFVDGSEFAASVVGRDSESDLALLKINPGDRKLKPIAFADSDAVRVGDIVFAIGSPYGYNHTVTMGIVSAKHRKISIDKPYEDFVQTDAAINPGNSGGALVNLNGQLVGLNTAIVSENRANAGIGMAIASNLVRWVKDRLIRDGRVRRGYMGIAPLDLDPRLAREAFGEDHPLAAVDDLDDLIKALGLKEPRGVLIAKVVSRSPAAAVPLQPLDVLVELNGKPVRNSQDLFFRVAEIEPGSRVPLKFSRQGKLMQAQVELAERPPGGFGWPR